MSRILPVLALAWALVWPAQAADDQDFRLLWFLLHESGGVQQQEQWSVSCTGGQCSISHWVSGKDVGSRQLVHAKARELMASAEALPTAQKSAAPAGGDVKHVEELRVSLATRKSWAKFRPDVGAAQDFASGFAWTSFELDLRHAWDGSQK